MPSAHRQAAPDASSVEPELARMPASVEEFLAELLRDSTPRGAKTSSTSIGAASQDSVASDAPDEGYFGSGIVQPTVESAFDVEQLLVERAPLFRAAFASTEKPMRRWSSIVAPQIPERTTQPLNPSERMLIETQQGQQLIRAIRETVPSFACFQHAGFYLDRLTTYLFHMLSADDRFALIRRVAALAATEAGLVAPPMSDGQLALLAARAGLADLLHTGRFHVPAGLAAE